MLCGIASLNNLAGVHRQSHLCTVCCCDGICCRQWVLAARQQPATSACMLMLFIPLHLLTATVTVLACWVACAHNAVLCCAYLNACWCGRHLSWRCWLHSTHDYYDPPCSLLSVTMMRADAQRRACDATTPHTSAECQKMYSLQACMCAIPRGAHAQPSRNQKTYQQPSISAVAPEHQPVDSLY